MISGQPPKQFLVYRHFFLTFINKVQKQPIDMKRKHLLYLLPLMLLASILVASELSTKHAESEEPDELSLDTDFDKMMAVLTHKRCVNCHPNDNVPKQGEDSHPHYFGMMGGDDHEGFEAIRCNTCHQQENDDYSGVPGAPHWALAPPSMMWEGLSRTEIAASMLDPKRNGGRSHHEVLEHLTEHELVLWAWDPGVNAEGVRREPPPVPKEEYIEAVKNWFEDGAQIPAE